MSSYDPDLAASVADGSVVAVDAGLRDSAVLRFPLLDLQRVGVGGGQTLGPFRSVDVAHLGLDEDHDGHLN